MLCPQLPSLSGIFFHEFIGKTAPRWDALVRIAQPSMGKNLSELFSLQILSFPLLGAFLVSQSQLSHGAQSPLEHFSALSSCLSLGLLSPGHFS